MKKKLIQILIHMQIGNVVDRRDIYMDIIRGIYFVCLRYKYRKQAEWKLILFFMTSICNILQLFTSGYYS